MNKLKRIEELEAKIGCGVKVTSTFMPWPETEPKTIEWYCGRYYGDDGPAYCEKCDSLIDELWDLQAEVE